MELWWALCLLCWLLHKGLRAFDGMYFLLYVAWYGLGRGFIEGLRTDSLYLFSTGIRTSQLVAFLSCAAAVCLVLWKLHRHPKPEDLYVNRKRSKSEPTTEPTREEQLNDGDDFRRESPGRQVQGGGERRRPSPWPESRAWR